MLRQWWQRFTHRLWSQPGADRLQGLNARRWDERLTPSLPLMTDLVRGDAGISAGLARGALRCLGLGRALGRAAAETCAHKLLAGVALHAAGLAVAILHSLLLSSQCVRGWRDRDRQNNSDNKSYHWLPPENKDTGETGPSMQQGILDFEQKLKRIVLRFRIATNAWSHITNHTARVQILRHSPDAES